MDLDEYAHMLDQLVIDSFLRCCKTGAADVLSTPIKTFKQYYCDVPFTDVLNLCCYERWYGNFCSVINTIVFTPQLYTFDVDRWKYVVNDVQLCDIYHTLFRIIIDDGLKTNGFLDYYDHTVSMMVTSSYNEDMPAHLVGAIKQFKWLFRVGSKVIGIQQKLVRDWLQRLQKKRLKALVLKIEDIWLPILASPDTPCGKRLLKSKIARWIDEDQNQQHC